MNKYATALRDHARRFGLLEPKILLLLFGFFLTIWGFQEIADDVFEGDTHAIDTQLLLMLRTPGDVADPIGPRWLEEVMGDISALGGIALLTLITFLAVVYLAMTGKGVMSLFLLATVVTGTVASNLLKAGFDRPRPDLVPHDIAVYTASFPSGHSMMAALVYLTLGAMLAQAHSTKREKIYFMVVAIVITLMVGFSRVYLGVHWPTDVLAGWCIGAFWAMACWAAYTVWQRRCLQKK